MKDCSYSNPMLWLKLFWSKELDIPSSRPWFIFIRNKLVHKTVSVSIIILDKHFIQFAALTKTDAGFENTFEHETKNWHFNPWLRGAYKSSQAPSMLRRRNLNTGGFTLKEHQIILSTLRRRNWKRNNHKSFWICVWGKTRSGKSRDYRDVIVFEKFHFFFHTITQSRCFQVYRLEERLRKISVFVAD